MARRVVGIEKAKASTLYAHCLARLGTLDIRSGATVSNGILFLLAGDARRVVNTVLANCADADADLGIAPDDCELAAREYLSTLTAPGGFRA